MRTQCCGVLAYGQCSDCPFTVPVRPVPLSYPLITGWRCPNCGAGNAPTMPTCPNCAPLTPYFQTTWWSGGYQPECEAVSVGFEYRQVDAVGGPSCKASVQTKQ